MKIHSINPSNSMGLENRLDPGRRKSCGKAYHSKNDVTFDEYLEAQLKHKDFSSHFKKAGQPGGIALKKSSSCVAEARYGLTWNNNISKFHNLLPSPYTMLPEALSYCVCRNQHFSIHKERMN